MAKITKQTSQVSHKTNECQNDTALTRWLPKIIYFLHKYILHCNIRVHTTSRKLKRFIRFRIEQYLPSLPQIIILQGCRINNVPEKDNITSVSKKKPWTNYSTVSLLWFVQVFLKQTLLFSDCFGFLTFIKSG